MTRRQPTPAGLGGALRDFFAKEVAGGAVLAVAAVTALVWANSPWADAYDTLWTADLGLDVGDWSLDLDLRHWVNDGLMAIFFVVVALEVKREMLEGELRDPRKAALPVIAAVGGMVVPAALYFAVNPSGDAARGWGIPMATDIAFALGVAALVARSLPSGLRLFLLALAIVDDIGAILVIAVVYSSGVEPAWVGLAALLVSGAYVLRRARVMVLPGLVVLGVGAWLALHEAGVHPTLAGVAMGFVAPASIEDELHPWTSFVVIPIFAVANAGVSLSASDAADAWGSRVMWGVVLGLVVGKTVGISLFSWLAVRSGVAALPAGATWRQLVGTAALAGIGFTVSLFVAGLAFDRPDLVDHAKIGILSASALATVLAAAVLLRAPRDRRTGEA